MSDDDGSSAQNPLVGAIAAQAELVRAAGEYRLDAARADLQDAQAAGVASITEMRREAFEQAQLDLLDSRRRCFELEQQRQLAERMAVKLGLFAAYPGADMETCSWFWQAFSFFMLRYPLHASYGEDLARVAAYRPPHYTFPEPATGDAAAFTRLVAALGAAAAARARDCRQLLDAVRARAIGAYDQRLSLLLEHGASQGPGPAALPSSQNPVPAGDRSSFNED